MTEDGVPPFPPSYLGHSLRNPPACSPYRRRQINLVTSSPGATCCRQGHPLRPSLLWMDMRSAGCAEQVAGTGDAALGVNSAGEGPVSAEWMIPKVPLIMASVCCGGIFW